MSCSNEQLDEAGNPIRVADLTFIEGILGTGAYGTVHLARRHPNFYDYSSSAMSTSTSTPATTAQSPEPAPFLTPTNSSHRTLVRVGSAGLPVLPTSTNSNGMSTPTPRSGYVPRSRRGDNVISRSNSAPAGNDFFNIVTTPTNTPATSEHRPAAPARTPSFAQSPIVQKASHTFQSIFRSDSMKTNSGGGGGSNSQHWSRKSSTMSDNNNSNIDPEGQLVAVKIFRKSVLKRKRTMERDKETRRMLVKTALEKVEREIALMKKLAHPNLVEFYEAIDSPDSDCLYLVRLLFSFWLLNE